MNEINPTIRSYCVERGPETRTIEGHRMKFQWYFDPQNSCIDDWPTTMEEFNMSGLIGPFDSELEAYTYAADYFYDVTE